MRENDARFEPHVNNMHEFALVKTLLEQVDRLRCTQPAGRVVAIHVSVGEFSGVEPELFQEAYEVSIETSPLCGAELQMTRVPLQAHCQDCEAEFAVHKFRFQCPTCAGRELTLVRGEGLVLESVTLEQEPA